MVAEQLFQPVPGGSGRYIEGLAPALPPRVHAVGITATASGASRAGGPPPITRPDAPEQLRRVLRTAMAYGSAAANLPGTTLPTPRDLPALAAAITPLA